jgi:carbonic anhydrase/acetyltransferase-like protein (isoleucine patch superfamily)
MAVLAPRGRACFLPGNLYNILIDEPEWEANDKMAIYSLGTLAPSLPDAGQFWVAPDANVIGRVRLGTEVGIWFGAVLRGDNELIDIGARSNIQEGAMLHTDPGHPLVVGTDVTVGHHAILHGCRVGNNTLIGMGATILNGAVIGANCLVGANALVTEDKQFPDFSLIVGSPAKVMRTLDAAAAERITASAQRYVANWRRFVSELKRLG